MIPGFEMWPGSGGLIYEGLRAVKKHALNIRKCNANTLALKVLPSTSSRSSAWIIDKYKNRI